MNAPSPRVKLGLGLFAAAVLVVVAAYGWYAWKMSTPADKTGGRVEVLVERGATFGYVTETLYYHGLVPDPALFELRARQRGRRGKLSAGLYVFDLAMTPDEVLDHLAGPPDRALDDVPLKLTIIPGENIWQVRETLQKLGIEDDLLALDRDAARLKKLGVGPTKRPPRAWTALEGYLFPDTYHLDRKNPNLGAAVRSATRQFRRVWSELKSTHQTRYAALKRQYGFDDHDFVILASLVEKEVAALPEAPMVAAVFYNRLEKGMRLATDPTMVYGPETWRERPSPRFRRDKTHPYNTYHVKKLPPGPICNPGRRALEAVLTPATTDALYFVARRDGTGRHAFARTLAEHKRNIEKYLK